LRIIRDYSSKPLGVRKWKLGRREKGAGKINKNNLLNTEY
jgi:hypothetical protein